MSVILENAEDTVLFGRALAKSLKPGTILALHGDVGAGKTTCVKGIAAGLGISEEITSPTFTLMNTYSVPNSPTGIRELVHVDTYRLESEEELIRIGIEDYLGDPKTLCIIEWPEKLSRLLQHTHVIDLSFEHTPDGKRRVTGVPEAC